MSFQLVPKSVTLNDLERRNGVISANSGSFRAHCVKVHVRYLISWWVVVVTARRGLWWSLYTDARVCLQIVAMMKAYVEKSHCHGDDVVTQLGCLSEQLELTTTIEEIDSLSDLLSDFAQLQIDRIRHVPRWHHTLSEHITLGHGWRNSVVQLHLISQEVHNAKFVHF